MATYFNYHRNLLRSLVLFGLLAFGQALTAKPNPGRPKNPAPAKPAPPIQRALVFSSEAQLRQAVFDTAATFIGKLEGSVNNSADWIAAINRFNHLPLRAHYCASAFFYVHARNGIRLPVGSIGRVASYFGDPRRIIYRKNQRGNSRIGQPIRRMDAVSLFASHIEAIAQDRYDPETDDRVKLIGFNTSGGKGTRDGCYVNSRRTSEIKAIANWITPYVAANPSILSL